MINEDGNDNVEDGDVGQNDGDGDDLIAIV